MPATQHPSTTGAPCITCGRGFLDTSAAILVDGAYVHPGCWYSVSEVQEKLVNLRLEVGEHQARSAMISLGTDLGRHGWTGLEHRLHNLERQVAAGLLSTTDALRLVSLEAFNLPQVG